MKTRTLVIAVLVVAVAGIGVLGVRHLREARKADAPRADPAPIRQAPAAPQVVELAPTDLARAESREIRRDLPLTGQLRPSHQAFLRAKVAGEVLEMRVKEGETVKSGQVVARIDPVEYQARLDERLATLAANKATWENNERTRKNNEELLRKNFISQQAYDNALANTSVAEAQVKAAEANVALAKKSLDDTLVRTPWAGLVAERSAQVGDKASVDTRLITLVDLSRMELEAQVPASEIPSVVVGQEVAFWVEGFGTRTFKGTVARIAPQSGAGSRSIAVYVEIANPDGSLKGGMFAKGRLTLSKSAAVTAVPLSALREERGEIVVYAVSGGKVGRVAVKTGTRNEEEDWVEVTEGLAAGTEVVKTNLGSLTPGVAVRIAGAARPAPAPAPGTPPAEPAPRQPAANPAKS